MRKYDSPAAFKQSLEQRLRISSTSGVDFARRRQLLVFDRFLARVVRVMGDAAILKGGLALELCLDRARTTKDIDLRMVGSPEEVLERLQEAGRLDLGDFMTFEVRAGPVIAGPAAVPRQPLRPGSRRVCYGGSGDRPLRAIRVELPGQRAAPLRRSDGRWGDHRGERHRPEARRLPPRHQLPPVGPSRFGNGIPWSIRIELFASDRAWTEG